MTDNAIGRIFGLIIQPNIRPNTIRQGCLVLGEIPNISFISKIRHFNLVLGKFQAKFESFSSAVYDLCWQSFSAQTFNFTSWQLMCKSCLISPDIKFRA